MHSVAVLSDGMDTPTVISIIHASKMYIQASIPPLIYMRSKNSNDKMTVARYIFFQSQKLQKHRDGALVESITFNRRVVGSTPALAIMQGPWASPLPAVACALRRETPIQYPCCSRECL